MRIVVLIQAALAAAPPTIAVAWLPREDDLELAFGVDINTPPMIRPDKDFQAFETLPAEQIQARLFDAEAEPSRRESRDWAAQANPSSPPIWQPHGQAAAAGRDRAARTPTRPGRAPPAPAGPADRTAHAHEDSAAAQLLDDLRDQPALTLQDKPGCALAARAPGGSVSASPIQNHADPAANRALPAAGRGSYEGLVATQGDNLYLTRRAWPLASPRSMPRRHPGSWPRGSSRARGACVWSQRGDPT